MKVICINNRPIVGYANGDLDKLVVGEEYTVIELVKGRYPGYILEEINTDNPIGFAIQRFAPLSDIDETELIKQRESVLV